MRISQVRLRTIFLAICCAAIGLTCATSTLAPEKLFFIELPTLKVHHGLMATASAIAIVGLLQQIRVLLARSKKIEPSGSQRCALRFAVWWRIAIAVLIAACLVARILISRGMITLSESEHVYMVGIFPDTLLQICLIVVLTNSIWRWASPKRQGFRFHTFNKILAMLGGIAFATVMLANTGLIHYLVYLALAAIEGSQPQRMHREGSYPIHESKLLSLFNISVIAAASLVLAIGVLIWVRSKPRSRGHTTIISFIYILLLAVPAATCTWYYLHGLPRFSPDMADVGITGSWFEITSGSLLVILLVVAAAFRISQSDVQSDSITIENIDESSIFANDTVLSLLVLFGAAASYFVEMYSVARWYSLSGPGSVLTNVGNFLQQPTAYLILAIGVLSLQVVWARWKHRKEPVAWRLSGLDCRQFTTNVAAFSLLAIVGLPTLSMFSFTVWFGPWYR
jgi:hypothetical protein